MILLVGRGDREHVGQLEAGGVERIQVCVGGVVAGRGDDEHVVIAGADDLILERDRIALAAPAVREDTDVGRARGGERIAHLDGELHRLDGVGVPAGADAVHELERHDARGPVHAADADAVVAGGTDDAGHARAVAVIVERVAVHGDRIEAVRARRAGDIDAADVHGERRRRRPDVVAQVGVRVVDAGVDDADDEAARARGDAPGIGRIDAGAGHRFAQRPLAGKKRIVRQRRNPDLVVRLGVEHVALAAQTGEQFAGAVAARPQPAEAGADRLVDVDVEGGGQCLRHRRLPHLHDHFTCSGVAAVDAFDAGRAAGDGRLPLERGVRDERDGNQGESESRPETQHSTGGRGLTHEFEGSFRIPCV